MVECSGLLNRRAARYREFESHHLRSMNYQILLYYKYTPIQNPVEFKDSQKLLCEKLGLKGRILIAEEGINGTLEGTIEATEKYITIMKSDARFVDINWKKSEGIGNAFPKLSVKVRKEIVTTGVENKDFGPLYHKTGKYLSAEELFKWYEEGREFYVIDTRNDFEFEVGRFKNSILPDGLYHFRDLPNLIKSLEHLKHKTIVTVCTGGVRCETASGLFIKYGFTDIYQLHNGMVTFMEKFPNKYFEGKLYVFDQRMIMGFNTDSAEHKVIGKCRKCGAKSENLVNWNEDGKRLHGIICEDCCRSGKVTLQGLYKQKYQSNA